MVKMRVCRVRCELRDCLIVDTHCFSIRIGNVSRCSLFGCKLDGHRKAAAVLQGGCIALWTVLIGDQKLKALISETWAGASLDAYDTSFIKAPRGLIWPGGCVNASVGLKNCRLGGSLWRNQAETEELMREGTLVVRLPPISSQCSCHIVHTRRDFFIAGR